MKIIAVTGGIGSGKTELCKVLAELGAIVFYADEEVRKLQNNNPTIITNLKKEFGNSIYSANNTLDRTTLASIVFSNPQKLTALNRIIHPELINHFQANIDECIRKNCKILIFEAAILFEMQMNVPFDLVINVSTPLEKRLQFLKMRGIPNDKALTIINNQISEDERNAKANTTIINDGTKDDLRKKAIQLWNHLNKET